MKGLRVSAKGPPLVLLSIALLLPECVVSAPKVGRDDINRHEGNPIKHSFSQKNELETVDESWYPFVVVSNDYYDQKDEDADSQENIFDESELEAEENTPSALTLGLPKKSLTTNYTTFCEEVEGSCPPEDYEDDDSDDIDSDRTLETKLTNKTNQVNNSTSDDDSIGISSPEVNGESAKSEVVRDLENELDCLIEDVELILEHTKQIVKDSSVTKAHSLPQTLKSNDMKKGATTSTNKPTKISNSQSTEFDNDAIEDEDLIESMDTDVHVQVHSDLKKVNPQQKSSAKDEAIKDQDLQGMLDPQKLEEIIMKEHNGSQSHNGSHTDHHVKEHK